MSCAPLFLNLVTAVMLGLLATHVLVHNNDVIYKVNVEVSQLLL